MEAATGNQDPGGSRLVFKCFNWYQYLFAVDLLTIVEETIADEETIVRTMVLGERKLQLM